jgi:hypothetical protein
LVWKLAANHLDPDHAPAVRMADRGISFSCGLAQSAVTHTAGLGIAKKKHWNHES